MPRSHLSYCAVRLLSLPCAFTPTKQAWSEDLDEVKATVDEVTATAFRMKASQVGVHEEERCLRE